GFRPRLSQIADRGEHVEVERRAERIGLARSSRLPVPAEVNRQHAETGLLERLGLLLPALLVESAAVSQHDAARALPVQVGVDKPPVLGREGDVLRRGGSGQQEGRHDCLKSRHTMSVTLLFRIDNVPQKWKKRTLQGTDDGRY